MAVVADSHFYQIGSFVIPAIHRPKECDGIMPAQGDDESLESFMIGSRGGGTARLWWNQCSSATFRYWFREINGGQLSIPVTTLILPDDAGLGDPVTIGSLSYPYHSIFYYAVVDRIVKIGTPRRVFYMSGTSTRIPYIEGGAEVIIRRIGEAPPYS